MLGQAMEDIMNTPSHAMLTDDIDHTDESFTNFEAMTKNLQKRSSKLEKQALIMRRHENAMKIMKRIMVELETSSKCMDNKKATGLVETLKAVVILHEDEDKVDPMVQKQAFEMLKEAYGFDGAHHSSEKKAVDNLRHLVKFTHFLHDRIKEAVNILKECGVQLSPNDFDLGDSYGDLSLGIDEEPITDPLNQTTEEYDGDVLAGFDDI
ncbi:hypothetical protein ROZALSC1DRAFT_29129 [Rozella allomycis CSF55]|uniref:Uncharacterized protein n=1 Tax=Rozella allomycis (strain CSF55) TaxID=988480 RepID=A0A075ATT2_ROZAC|nr:hypothetical protein O9G_000477 [Rozella allomycis CSF55]RKP19254.1 hypothetical protein ROZALSC1DRAFT_29129 [Rozella allomycis CSF55]|eukprot:EPZ33701.1 hypothetical protein O9G_000477 [Rozella allomycis CSF55]